MNKCKICHEINCKAGNHEIRIRGLSLSTKQKLFFIAKEKNGGTLSGFLRKKLNIIIQEELK